MPKETKTATALLTAQPKYGRVLTETIQPRDSGKPAGKVPVLISGVGTSPRQTIVKADVQPSQQVARTTKKKS
jgi:hypothetical protein